jgi:hypothetical protein
LLHFGQIKVAAELFRTLAHAKLLFPVSILGIARPKGKDGVRQGLALIGTRMDTDEHCAIAAALDVPRAEVLHWPRYPTHVSSTL